MTKTRPMDFQKGIELAQAVEIFAKIAEVKCREELENAEVTSDVFAEHRAHLWNHVRVFGECFASSVTDLAKEYGEINA